MSRPSDVKTAIRMAAGGKVNVQAVAAHILPIEQAQFGMELAMTKSGGAIKIVLTF